MSAKRRPGTTGSSRRDRQEATAVQGADSATAPTPASAAALADGRVRFGLIIVALVLAAIVVMGADYAFGTLFGNGAGAGAGPSATATATATVAR